MTTYTHIPIIDDWTCRLDISPYEKQGFSGKKLGHVFIELVLLILAKQLQDSSHRVYPKWEHLWEYNNTEGLDIASNIFDFSAIDDQDPILENIWHKTYEDTYENVCQLKSKFGTSGGEQRELVDNELFFQWCCTNFGVDSLQEVADFVKSINFSPFMINNLLTELKLAWSNSGISIKQTIIDNVSTSKPSTEYIGISLSSGYTINFAAYYLDTDRTTAFNTILNKYITILKTIIGDITTIYISSDDELISNDFINLCKQDDALKDLSFIYKSDILRRKENYTEKTYTSSETIDYYQKRIEEALILGQSNKLIAGYSTFDILTAILGNLDSDKIVTLDEIGTVLFCDAGDNLSDGQWTLDRAPQDLRQLGEGIITSIYESKQPF